jgi:hypothetical protein
MGSRMLTYESPTADAGVHPHFGASDACLATQQGGRPEKAADYQAQQDLAFDT